MHDVINLTGYQSILCLNGDLPELSFFTGMNVPIIAADGAANSLLDLGIRPQLITGDLDSVRPAILEDHPFLHSADQNYSDFQKAMRYLKDNDLLPAIVVGINGGHLDHILNNINIFMETNCLLYAPPIRGFVLNEKSHINCLLPTHTKISLIGIPTATISSKGLQWELNNSQLSFPGKTSCFNRTRLSEVALEIHQGSVLVLIYEQMIEDAGLSVL
ncbi:thiamin pyrophosphokinase [Legionella steigerwaltii]|uniref:Thiamine diphosphokinase n=1 Tax=Legionella steigerwaltii TaxID=460 RepID=A0A378L725_9GAMM|nr:thiamine diphosphokinase [Legionella steigerwaltii]KTD69956.1 thiamin pyrophosphokinase [Legionella steigerwaltii]STY21732.1 thiamin pyrophosphokinase [Legionella steigerwaltii]